ncbi:MAG TPA: methyltransferase domain-containing protein [Solirubrobacteraceae bacterium]|nr:methyltransferase domain-containing protein [Solirubrobacteraceae bacterium]
MSTTSISTAPDLAAVKAAQQRTWSSGDYHAVAARITVIAERLVDSADLRAGSLVLDVASGSANATLAAARSGCDAVGIDYVPELLQRGRERARAEGLDVELVEGDAEALPVDDGAFDAVLSVVGVMFAPDHRRAAAELLRACRPGGTIALANWTPRGFVGQLLRTVGAHVPPPAGVASPLLWGTREHLDDLLGDGVASLGVRERSYTFRSPSAQAFVDFFRDFYGPTHVAFGKLDDAGKVALERDLLALVREHDRLGLGDGAPVAIDAEYVEAIAIRA